MTTPCKFKNGTCVHCGDTTQGQCEGWNGSDTNALMAAARLALEALEEYANQCNWEEDFQGTKRKWLEPDSNSRNQYDGYELAQRSVTALKKAGVQ